MAALTPVDATLSIGERIGRYFTMVSLIPSLFLVLWTYILIASGAPSGHPELHNITVALSHWSVSKAAAVVLISLAVATVLHPLQFITTQLLEGYWGTTPFAAIAMKKRIVHHRKQQRDLRTKAGSNQRAWRNECLKYLREKHTEWQEDPDDIEIRISDLMESEQGDGLMRYVIAEQEARDHADSYPSDATRILPTRLGNALRSFEDSAGKQYGLDAITIVPRLHLVVPDRHRSYMMDARESMDSAIRICTVGLVATVLTIGFFLTSGLWLLWALLPYFIGYLAYKGAVSAAQSYGIVIASVIDLDRFLLYDELGLRQPQDNREEKLNNIKLMHILAGGDKTTLLYKQEQKITESSAPDKSGTSS
jgi:hypothetical protein